MTGLNRRRCLATHGMFVLTLLSATIATRSQADTVILKDGRKLEGTMGTVAGLAQNPNAPNQPKAPQIQQILLIDDNLRRIFVPKLQVSSLNPPGAGPARLAPIKIHIPQQVAIAGARIGRVGPIIKIDPFDEFGRRIFRMLSDKGPLNVIQGITEITPEWTRVQGLAGKQPYIWDMRIATSSIPREVLSKIIMRNMKKDKLDDRLKLVKFYLEGERYQDAQKELEEVVHDFPGQGDLEKEIRSIRQLHSRRVIDEIKHRRQVGQARLAYEMLQNFPQDDVAGETLQQVRQMVEEMNDVQTQGTELLASLKTNLEGISDAQFRRRAQIVVDEISTELNINTLDRMADYQRLAVGGGISDEEKMSLAVSGWLLGSNNATTNLAVALSLYEVRDLVRQYLREPLKMRRNSIVSTIKSQEGGTPDMVAKLIAHMKPPIDSPAPEENQPGFYALEVPSLDKEPNVNYYMQLPPEYDPHRRYPTVVTLNGSGTTPQQQIDWWAGAQDERGNRLGQATRHGYIVIAVDWAKPDQKEYEYSAREHAAVLVSLRDACRRFSVDTDRVFLSGHSMGGDAAWDLAVAHPDTWAGVIPVVAVADKYIAFYSDNAGLVPFYVVAGEMDGDKTVRNARDLDRCLNKKYDFTVVEYQGRGHEHFHDEIQRIFDWMGRRERNFFPKQFQTTSMRTWDNYFWWLELSKFPTASIVEPSNWPPGRNFHPVQTKASIKGNSIYVTSGAEKATVWLCPELIDFQKPAKLNVNGRKSSHPLAGDLATLLDDVRTRGERLHPFWVKIE